MQTREDLLGHYRRTHASRVYGASSVKSLRFLRPWIRITSPSTLLDYGCGQSPLIERLDLGWPVACYRYDPAIPEHARLPDRPVDLLLNVDVLEHIAMADLPQVLNEMRGICRHALIVVDTKAAQHRLADGRNAHITLQPHAWWAERLREAFGHVEPIPAIRRTRAGFKTWVSPPAERLAYWRLRLAEDAAHYAARLARRKDH